jgi:DNA-binding response OmpR family regulator
MRVLVVDDDIELLELVKRALERDGHEVWASTTAEQGIELVRSASPEIAVVDLGLPGMSGEELTTQLRQENHPLAILVLTAQSAVSSRVRCLDGGADDYLTKPFAIAELRARVRALSRRVPREAPLQKYVRGEVELDFQGRRATCAKKHAPITAREWAILEILANRSGHVVERREIIERVWNQPEDENTQASLEVLVGRIRRKLDPSLLRTLRGHGYLLEEGTTT